jgi:uncharacterized protein (TIGR02001 family)
MKNIASITTLTLVAAAAMADAAPAVAPASAWTQSSNLALTSNYIWRGVSQSNDSSALSGGFDAAHTSGLSAGVWASNVDSSLGGLEIDLYAAYGFKVGAVDVSVGYINYVYNTAANGGEANVSATISGLQLKVSKGVTGALNEYYYEANYSYDIAAIKGLNLGLHYGSERLNNNDDYAIALSYPVLGFTGTVSFSDIQNGESITAFSLKKTF